MVRVKFSTALSLLLFICFSLPATEPVFVAISAFRINGLDTGKEWLGESFADGLVEEFVQSRYIRVVERQYLHKILEEMSIQQSGLIDPQTAAEAGKLVGAQIFIFGSLSLLENQAIVRARIVDVTRGEMKGAVSVEGNIVNILALQQRLAQQIAVQLAVEVAFLQTDNSPPPEINISVYQKLKTVNKIYDSLPVFGLDPARRRKTGEYLFAINELNDIINEVPSLAVAFQRRGTFYLQYEKYQMAEEDFLTASKMYPNNREVILSLVNFYIIQRNYKKAEIFANKFITMYPENSYGWFALGQLNSKQFKYRDAVLAYLFAVQKEPFLPKAEQNLKVILRSPQGGSIIASIERDDEQKYLLAKVYLSFWNNRIKKVQSEIQRLSLSMPHFYFVRYLNGMIFLNQKKYKEAVSEFKKTLSLNPEFPLVHRELGKSLIQTGQYRQGKLHLKIYLATANFVDDFEEVNKYMKK